MRVTVDDEIGTPAAVSDLQFSQAIAFVLRWFIDDAERRIISTLSDDSLARDALQGWVIELRNGRSQLAELQQMMQDALDADGQAAIH